MTPLLAGLFAALLAAAAPDPTGSYPRLGAGPGLTYDEGYNVEHGVVLVDRLLDLDAAGFRDACGLLPDHPPLGRLWLGLWHELALIAVPPAATDALYSIAAARFGSAAAFGVLVALQVLYATRWHGRCAGILSAWVLICMPRLFGHAHIASLEMCTCLTYAAVVYQVAEHWTSATPPSNRQACLSGVLLGVALLTKVQAVLLPLPLATWAFACWRGRAWRPMGIAALTAAACFLAGWPWLWGAPLPRIAEYLGKTTHRANIYVWYFGQSLADTDVPWHYPWLIFAATVPLGLQLLGVVGVCQSRGWRQPRESLLLACLAFPLLIFSLPGVAVYDGERLFLIVFPLWGMFVARGGAWLWQWTRARRYPALTGCVCVALLFAQGWGTWHMAPCYLSYYNVLVGGVRGAERLGLQTTYWGDSITRDLLHTLTRHLPPGTTVEVAPVPDAFYLKELERQSPLLQHARLKLAPYDGRHSPPRPLLMALRREYLPPELRRLPPDGELRAQVERDGVPLAIFVIPEQKGR